MIAPARRAAFRALRAIAGGDRDAPSAIAEARRALRDPRDVGLVYELVSGVLRWQAALDAGLAGVSSTPVDRLDHDVRLSLRLAAYQLVYLTRVPPSAVVNDAVSIVREAGLAKAAGFVNAVLRRVTPDQFRAQWPPRPAVDCASRLPGPDARRAVVDYLAVTLSHPRWLVERWVTRYGFETAVEWVTFNNTSPPLTLRPVLWKLDRETLAHRLDQVGVTAEVSRWAPRSLTVTSGNPFQSSLADAGLFMAQDEASQLVAQLAADLRPATVLDVCAAPGGKTTYLHGERPAARIVACDHRARRVRLLRETLDKTAAAVPVVQANANQPLPFLLDFDLVFVDAPCSGLGTIRREPDIRWRRTESDLAVYAEAQQRILGHASACVRGGGHLLYATCSSEPEENEQVVEQFLAANPGFTRLELPDHPWRESPLRTLLDERADLRTLPAQHQLEAFYAAVLVRGPQP